MVFFVRILRSQVCGGVGKGGQVEGIAPNVFLENKFSPSILSKAMIKVCLHRSGKMLNHLTFSTN